MKEIGKHYSLVVSTGGGVVTCSENWGILHQGIVIWLDPSRDLVLARLKLEESKQPLMNTPDPAATFDLLNKDRLNLYQEADLCIQIEDQSPEEVASLIQEKLPSIIIHSGNSGAQQTIED